MRRAMILSAALLAWGCGGDDDTTPDGDVQIDLTTEVAAVPTVVRVAVTTDRDVPIRVEYGEGGAFDRVVEDAGGTAHELLLVGLPQATEVSVRVVADGTTSEVRSVTTGTLDTPEPTVEGEPGAWLALSMLGDASTWVVVVDPQGRVVWSWKDPSGLATFRARLLPDGSGVVYNRAESGPDDDAAIVRVTWDGVETVTPVPELAHDFVLEDDGSVVALGYEERAGVLGNTLIRVGTDGTSTTFWTAWDCFDPSANPGDDPAHGWTHTNALDADGDGWLVGMRNLSTIARVDPDGTCPWALGGTGGTLALTGPAFEHQHQFEFDGEEFLVFDNDGAPGNTSRVLGYTVDLSAGTATQTGLYIADPPVYSFILGDVHRLADDGLLIVWSTAGEVDRLGADGVRAMRWSVPGEMRLGFVEVWDTLP